MIITLRECDAVELITTLEFLADWLAADCQVAAERLGLHGTYNIARLEADIRRIALQLKEPFRIALDKHRSIDRGQLGRRRQPLFGGRVMTPPQGGSDWFDLSKGVVV